MEELFALARESSEARVWSLAVEMARNSEFVEELANDPDERLVRVVRGRSDKVVTVTLSVANQSWQCDCHDEDDPCQHVLAAMIALRQGKVERGVLRSTGASVGSVAHTFSRSGKYLAFNRSLRYGSESVPFDCSLSAALERYGKGQGAVALAREDHQIDHVLPAKKAGVFDPRTMGYLLKGLARVGCVEFEGRKVSVAANPLDVVVEVADEDGGFRVRRASLEAGAELFENGVALIDNTLVALRDDALSVESLDLIRGDGSWFPSTDRLRLATQVIPALERGVQVLVSSPRIPRARRISPRAIIETFGDESGDHITAVARVVYGDPVLAEVFGERIEYRRDGEVPIRDRALEQSIYRAVTTQLGLRPKEAKVFHGEDAVRFAQKLRGWETSGGGTSSFMAANTLEVRLDLTGEDVQALFESSDGQRIDGEVVARAWREGASFVRLPEGGWGAIPRLWLQEHYDALERVLTARTSTDGGRGTLLPDVTELCESVGTSLPEYFQRLRAGLESPGALTEMSLPADVAVGLRSYQADGVRWLEFLRRNNLGALLADDMGLGKTLQTLSVIRGRSLVVCPTSVLQGWEREAAKFRPELKVSRYHGAGRALDPNADLTLTSYAILRLDIDTLSEVPWEMVILDESQAIKNPDSQVARAAFRLRGDFRVSLSGTPVENSLQDLWSQFHFLNPGLLGTREEFSSRFERAISDGDTEASKRLKRRVAPFTLRRLKRDVAKELPPKTEVVLECELTDEERLVYDALLGASRGELLEKLSEGRDIFSALEALLRLRQACCHIGLLPGQSAGTSSKVSLLVESLAKSIASGHRALVFSQWTSLLDRVEPELAKAAITFSRIDGSTPDRGAVVREFQEAKGPSVLLLSLKAGGVGLNLTAADHVYILDPWWNPAAEDQAADRAYRIGQENPVLVHRLVARDTVEERVLALQEQKRGLMQAAVGEGHSSTLSREDLLSLLAQ